MKAPRTILFDVNETLLNMNPMKEAINSLLENENGFQRWFALLLQYSLVDNCTNNYHDFVAIAGAAMDMAAIMSEKKIGIAINATAKYNFVFAFLKIEMAIRIFTAINHALPPNVPVYSYH